MSAKVVKISFPETTRKGRLTKASFFRIFAYWDQIMTDNDMHTDFLPAERQENNEIIKAYQAIDSAANLHEIIDAVTSIAIIINPQRQVVYANKRLYETLGTDDIDQVIGLRPGEILHCIHSTENKGGCGTSKSCSVCGAVLTIKKCIDESISTKDECRITTRVNGNIVSLDLLVAASPVKIGGVDYIVISLTDISNEKRKRILEKIFFHDIINIAGGLKSLIEFLRAESDNPEHAELLEMAEVSASSLMEEILSQRALIAAENGELETHFKTEDTLDIIKQVVASITMHDVAKNKQLIIANESTGSPFQTDSTILRRVLLNVVKNALEAIPEGEQVTISCKNHDHQITFFVQNTGVIDENIQLQIFQRSFSTKSSNRGLGTYSIRLLTERYLKGSVSFISDPEHNTIFMVTLPIEQPK